MNAAGARITHVGVVGLGIMGSAIARNLLAAGLQVTGYDPDPERAALGQAYGIRICGSVADCMRPAALLLSSLPHERALELTVEAVLAAHTDLAGRSGLAAQPVLVELSTLSLEAKRLGCDRLAQAGIGMLDCPISGTGAQAATGDLALYASGERATFDACHPVLGGFARAVHYVGEFGNGTRLKLIANLLVAIHNVATAEAMRLARLAGLDPLQACALLNSGAAASRILELRGPMVAREIYEPATMKLDVWQKDLRLIEAFARECGASTPLFDATRPLYADAIDAGLGALDTAAVARILQRDETPPLRGGG